MHAIFCHAELKDAHNCIRFLFTQKIITLGTACGANSLSSPVKTLPSLSRWGLKLSGQVAMVLPSRIVRTNILETSVLGKSSKIPLQQAKQGPSKLQAKVVAYGCWLEENPPQFDLSVNDHRNALSAISSVVFSRTVSTAQEQNGANSSVGMA